MDALIHDLVVNTLENMSDESTSMTLEKTAKNFESHPDYSPELIPLILSELEDFGPLQDLMEDPEVTEILVNGPKEIFYEKSGLLCAHDRIFNSPLTLRRLIGRLLLDMEKVADKRHPLVDGALSNGMRVHIALPPIVRKPALCIRKHSRESWSLEELARLEMMTLEQAEKIRTCVLEKKNILIVGATSSGKTTLLRALINEVPLLERIVTIEDTSELNIERTTAVSLVTREDPDGLVPPYTLGKLLKNALRMRPDRLVVGEVRDGEALTLLDALSTGHNGSMSSLHAGSPNEALARLEGLISRAAPQWSQSTIRQLIRDSIDVVIVVEKQNGLRKISQAVQIAGIESFGYLLDPIF